MSVQKGLSGHVARRKSSPKVHGPQGGALWPTRHKEDGRGGKKANYHNDRATYDDDMPTGANRKPLVPRKYGLVQKIRTSASGCRPSTTAFNPVEPSVLYWIEDRSAKGPNAKPLERYRVGKMGVISHRAHRSIPCYNVQDQSDEAPSAGVQAACECPGGDQERCSISGKFPPGLCFS